jgi:pimeloyl-ACP methyl ester carboxylesterase
MSGLAKPPWLIAGFVTIILALLHSASSARAPDKIGVVLMHGELGAPGRIIDGLAGRLEKAGYLVSRPDMCWSARRSYEQEFEACLAVVDGAIVRLRNLGATRIVVGGFSLGGAAAIVYGAAHPDLLGVFALAPTHDAKALANVSSVSESVARAKALVAQGKGETSASFADVAIGPSGAYANEIATTPNVYLSFFGDGSAVDIPKSVATLKPPLLWAASREDATQVGGAAAFAKTPPNPLNRYVEVSGSHLTTPDAASDAVLEWLAELGKKAE